MSTEIFLQGAGKHTREREEKGVEKWEVTESKVTKTGTFPQKGVRNWEYTERGYSNWEVAKKGLTIAACAKWWKRKQTVHKGVKRGLMVEGPKQKNKNKNKIKKSGPSPPVRLPPPTHSTHSLRGETKQQHRSPRAAD